MCFVFWFAFLNLVLIAFEFSKLNIFCDVILSLISILKELSSESQKEDIFFIYLLLLFLFFYAGLVVIVIKMNESNFLECLCGIFSNSMLWVPYMTLVLAPLIAWESFLRPSIKFILRHSNCYYYEFSSYSFCTSIFALHMFLSVHLSLSFFKCSSLETCVDLYPNNTLLSYVWKA